MNRNEQGLTLIEVLATIADPPSLVLSFGT